MSKRKQFIDYVINGGPMPICSPQIGAGAGFDASVVGKPYADLEDTIKVCRMFDMLPLFNTGFGVSNLRMDLSWEYKGERQEGTVKIQTYSLSTPYGDMVSEHSITEEGHGYRSKPPFVGIEDYEKFSWFFDELYKGDFSVYEKDTAKNRKIIGEEGALSYQWGMQPYELFSFPNTMYTMLFAMDYEKEFIELMGKCAEISKKIIDAVVNGGTDFVFLGGPAAEMVNPYIYETFMVPYGKMMTDYAHRKGTLIYSHICSPVEPFLSKGYFNQLGIDLFETLSMPPVGNVKSIEDAFSKLDKNMCTRGNVGIDVLIRGNPDDVTEAVNHIMTEAMKAKRKHMVAASDYLMRECKFENVKALCDAVKNFRYNKQ